MQTDKILKGIEDSILRVSKDIKAKKGAVGSDKLNSLSKLVNSYSRLVERSKIESKEDEKPGNSYYSQMVAAHEEHRRKHGK